MHPDTRRLHDILEASAELASYLDRVDESHFIADRLRQRAVERVLTMIGEAAKRLSPETREAIPQPWREIIRFRDRGVHAYDTLAPGMLHRIAMESVPELAAAVRAHLDGKPVRP